MYMYRAHARAPVPNTFNIELERLLISAILRNNDAATQRRKQSSDFEFMIELLYDGTRHHGIMTELPPENNHFCTISSMDIHFGGK
jgi:hypothetical protein